MPITIELKYCQLRRIHGQGIQVAVKAALAVALEHEILPKQSQI